MNDEFLFLCYHGHLIREIKVNYAGLCKKEETLICQIIVLVRILNLKTLLLYL